ncbi:MAG: hypothetical protein ACFFBP_10105 [Promethearchaeota archaeon]
MKIKKIYLVGFTFLFVCSSLLILNNNTLNNNLNHQNYENIKLSTDTDNLMIEEWNRTWGGNLSCDNGLVAVDSSNNVYLAGATFIPNVKSLDICLIKYDSSGMLQWNITLGSSDVELVHAIAIDSTDNIFVAGTIIYEDYEVGSDMFIVKFNSNGIYQLDTIWGGQGNDFCTDMVIDSNDNIFLSGYSSSFCEEYDDYCLVKFDNLCNLQWFLTWRDEGNGGECYAMTIDSTNNIYLSGWQNINIGIVHCLIKFNNQGVKQWYRYWKMEGYEDFTFQLAVDKSDNIYYSGVLWNYEKETINIYLIKFNNAGLHQWNTSWGGDINVACTSMALDSKGNIFLSGGILEEGVPKVLLVEFDNSGLYKWNVTWGGVDEYNTRDMVLDSKDNIYISGNVEDINRNLFLVKYAPFLEEVFKGFGLLQIENQLFFGEALLFLSLNNIEITIADQTALWDITYKFILGNLEVYYGKDGYNNIQLFIYRGEYKSNAYAEGDNVCFYGGN